MITIHDTPLQILVSTSLIKDQEQIETSIQYVLTQYNIKDNNIIKKLRLIRLFLTSIEEIRTSLLTEYIDINTANDNENYTEYEIIVTMNKAFYSFYTYADGEEISSIFIRNMDELYNIITKHKVKIKKDNIKLSKNEWARLNDEPHYMVETDRVENRVLLNKVLETFNKNIEKILKNKDDSETN